MTDIIRLDQNARRSRAVIAGQFVFLSGQFSDHDVGIEQQTREALEKIDILLARVGTDKRYLLTAQIWLKTMDDFNAMNAIWDAWVTPGCAPTRCCGVVEMADPEMRIEIVVSAVLAANPAP